MEHEQSAVTLINREEINAFSSFSFHNAHYYVISSSFHNSLYTSPFFLMHLSSFESRKWYVAKVRLHQCLKYHLGWGDTAKLFGLFVLVLTIEHFFL